MSPLPRRFVLLFSLVFASLWFVPAQAEKYRMAIHPVLPRGVLLHNFTPLVESLSKATEQEFEIVLSPGYLPHWQRLLRGNRPDFVYDGAHVIGYMTTHMNYVPLVKVQGVVSFSIVSAPDNLILDAEELLGRKVATVPAPSLGAMSLADLFDNPMRQPVMVVARDWIEAANLVSEGKVAGAMLPTPLLQKYPDLSVIEISEQYPHVALAASPDIPADLRKQVADLMVGLANTKAGQSVLAGLNIAGYEAANEALYIPHAAMLERHYGVPDGVSGHR